MAALAALGSWLLVGAAPITWDAPAGCPSGDAVDEQIAALVRSDASELSLVHGQVQRRGERWRVQLRLQAPGGREERRTFEAEDCRALARAVALIVAVHVDALGAATKPAVQRPESVTWTPTSAPRAKVRPAPSRDEPAPRSVAVVPASASSRTQPPPPADSPRPRVVGLLRFEGGVGSGILPGLGAGLGVVGGLTGRGWRVELGARGWPARTGLDASQTVGVRLDLVGGLVRGCGVPTLGRLRMPLCLGAEVAGLRGVGTTGVQQPATQWTGWGAANLSAGLSVAVTPVVAPYLALEGTVPLLQPQFSVGSVAVTQTGASGARLWLGLELHFGSRRGGRAKTIRTRPSA
ncbi:MAG: hypothetical protein AAF799_05505 [Myxococcota bacterium]